MSIQGNNSGPLTYLAAATPIPANSLVTLTATAGTVDLCAANGLPIGYADGAVAAAAKGCFQPLRGRVKLIASGAITAGNFVMPDSAGKVAVESNPVVRVAATTIGQAETDTTTDGDAIWVVCPR